MEKYETVLDKLAKIGAWGIYHPFLSLTPPQIVRAFEGILSSAAEHHHDDGVFANCELLFSAIADLYFLPLTKEEKGERVYQCDAMWGNVKIAVEIAQMDAACEILAALPLFKEREESKYDESKRSHVWVKVKDPTLPKSKAALMDRIAGGWRTIEDDEAAERAFSALLGFWKKTKVGKDKDLLQGILQDKVGSGFPAKRLERKIMETVPLSEINTCFGTDQIFQTLAKGWNRGSHVNYTSRLVHVSAPLRPASLGAWKWLACQSEAIAAADLAIKSLTMALWPQSELSWIDPRRAVIKVELRWQDDYDRSNRDDPYQKPGNSAFERAREEILKWREANPQIRVRLEVVIPNSTYGEKPYYRRCEDY